MFTYIVRFRPRFGPEFRRTTRAISGAAAWTWANAEARAERCAVVHVAMA